MGGIRHGQINIRNVATDIAQMESFQRLSRNDQDLFRSAQAGGRLTREQAKIILGIEVLLFNAVVGNCGFLDSSANVCVNVLIDFKKVLEVLDKTKKISEHYESEDSGIAIGPELLGDLISEIRLMRVEYCNLQRRELEGGLSEADAQRKNDIEKEIAYVGANLEGILQYLFFQPFVHYFSYPLSAASNAFVYAPDSLGFGNLETELSRQSDSAEGIITVLHSFAAEHDGAVVIANEWGKKIIALGRMIVFDVFNLKDSTREQLLKILTNLNEINRDIQEREDFPTDIFPLRVVESALQLTADLIQRNCRHSVGKILGCNVEADEGIPIAERIAQLEIALRGYSGAEWSKTFSQNPIEVSPKCMDFKLLFFPSQFIDSEELGKFASELERTFSNGLSTPGEFGRMACEKACESGCTLLRFSGKGVDVLVLEGALIETNVLSRA